jgi:archaellum component FlaG (FlaF/FlaG flagellin family)
MKQFFSLLFFLLITGFTIAADNFTVQWNFISVIDGYDHDNKIQVYIDGKLQAESAVFKQTKVGKVSMSVNPGSHQVRIVSLALYEGNWEEHSIANDYSIDAVYEAEHNFKKKSNSLQIVWDIDVTNTNFIWGGSGKAPKSDGKSVPVTVSWEFKGIESGYDHQCRMLVYVNGKQIQVSNTALESEGGKMVVMLPKGNISLKIMNEAYYEGSWEEHTIANNYSVDCFLIGDFTIKEQKKVHLLFDINKMETIVTWK